MPTIAQGIDKHLLYEASVQCVEAEIDMVDATFIEIRGYQANLLREDFCGTAQTSIEWIRRRENNCAIGVDLDTDVLAWSAQHHLASLAADEQSRIELVESDVCKLEIEPVQIILAMNFSYQLFQTRECLRNYFLKTRNALSDDGVLFIDAYGGYESYRELTEETQCDYEGLSWACRIINRIREIIWADSSQPAILSKRHQSQLFLTLDSLVSSEHPYRKLDELL